MKKIKTKTFLAVSGATLGFAGLVMAIAMPLGAKATSTVVVTPSNTQGWSSSDSTAGGAVNFIADSTAPSGVGALQLTTDSTTASKAIYLHAAPANTLLTSVTDLSYYTKQNSPSGLVADPSYQLPVFLNGTNGFTTLVYEPYQGGGAPIVNGTWQQWDVDQGMFWSTRTVICSNGTITGSPGGPAIYTLAAVQAACPTAVVLGYGVDIGSNNPSYNVETDLFNFNGTVYDFEPDTVTVTIDKYIDGAHATTTTANGSAFPMVSTWSDSINSGSGPYTLDPSGFNSNGTPYEAVTRNMTLGANYTTNEVTTGPVVSTTCTIGGAPYALVGYTTGATPAAAQTATPSATIPTFTNMQANGYVIVWNKTCTTPTTKDQCKDGGWKNFNTPAFKNQGDCVSFIATHGRNPANG